MKKALKKLTALLSSAVISFSAIPFFTANAEGLEVRDPFYNYNSNYNYYESEHFQFIWGNSGDASKVTTAFLEGNAKNLEDCWAVYMNDLNMKAPTQSTNVSLRDGKEYKTNIYISGTGLSGMDDDWAYMSYDSGGFAYMFCCVDAMQYNPPSWVLPHEFGHVVTAHQLGWNNNKYSYAWWEAMGNWFREQYLYSDYSNDNTGHGTDFFETYLKNMQFTFPCGRDYYAAWPFLQYLTENPDNMEGYGKDFVTKMLQQGQIDEYPFDMVDRLAPADLKETLGNFAKHMAALDFENGDSYKARLNELLSTGSWNWQQIYTLLEKIDTDTYAVPSERAPQHAGLNIIPLDITGNEISVTLNGETSIKGADWRACIVQCGNDGTVTYSNLFSDGENCTQPVIQNLQNAYLSVIATPDNDTYMKAGLPYGPDSEFVENNYPFTNKERYPYSVKLNGADIKKRIIDGNTSPWESYSPHPNGGGMVSSNARVDSTVYVGPNAKVMGNATVTGNAVITDYAVVQDSASVSDNAYIGGYAIIAENATVSGNARVDDTAMVMGRANVSGNAKVIESACVYGEYKISDYGCAKGNAFCMANGSISRYGTVDGDYYDDGGKTVTKGTAYGWVSSQSYVDSLPAADKLMNEYNFSDSGNYFTDKYNSTYGVVQNGGTIEAQRTGASGVLTLNGNNQYAVLDKSLLYTKDIDIQLAVLPRSSSGKQTLLHLGDDKVFLNISAFGTDGKPEITLSDGENKNTFTANEQLNLGEWAIIRLVIKDGILKLDINGATQASGEVSVTPEKIANNISIDSDNAVYRIGSDSKNENSLNGSIDFLRIYNSEAEAPTEKYTEKEVLTNTGDLLNDGKINVFDMIILKRVLYYENITDSAILSASDINKDNSVTNDDILILKNFLTAVIDNF